jgi:hypothetical protein
MERNHSRCDVPVKLQQLRHGGSHVSADDIFLEVTLRKVVEVSHLHSNKREIVSNNEN